MRSLSNSCVGIDKKPRAGLAIDFLFHRQPFSDSLSNTTTPELRHVRQTSSFGTATLAAGPVIPLQQQGSFSSSQGSGGNGAPSPAKLLDGSSTTSSFASNTPSSPGGSRLEDLRRFHISRSPATTKPIASPSRKRKNEPTVFTEQRKRPRTPKEDESPGKNVSSSDNIVKTEAPELEPKQKRPGRSARTSTPVKTSAPAPKASPAPLRNITLESGETLPWDVSSERLAAEMQAYTMQEIGRNMAQAEAERPKPKPAPTIRHSTPSKFKPKKPAQRYAERHPGEHTGMDVDHEYIEEEDVDESEYIIDTYIRYPAQSFESSGTPKSIGLLIIESQPDIDEFYREEDDSSEEEDEDDEDENGESLVPPST